MTTQLAWSDEARFAPERTSSGMARAFVGRQLLDHDLGYLVDDVRLVASELVTNAVEHARTPVRLRIEKLRFCVKLTVYDERADMPVDPLARRVEDDAEGGRGLWVTDACSTDWGTSLGSTGDKSVWAVFPVRQVPTV